MALGRKKSGGRKEPQFGLAASLSDLRLSAQDRVPAPADDEKPKKISGGKRKAPEPEDNDDEAPPPRERKPRASRASRKRKSSGRARPGLLRLVYWGAVLGL